MLPSKSLDPGKELERLVLLLTGPFEEMGSILVVLGCARSGLLAWAGEEMIPESSPLTPQEYVEGVAHLLVGSMRVTVGGACSPWSRCSGEMEAGVTGIMGGRVPLIINISHM